MKGVIICYARTFIFITQVDSTARIQGIDFQWNHPCPPIATVVAQGHIKYSKLERDHHHSLSHYTRFWGFPFMVSTGVIIARPYSCCWVLSKSRDF